MKSNSNLLPKPLRGIVPPMVTPLQDRDTLDLGIKALDENEDSEMIFTLRGALADNFFRAGEREEARRLYSGLQQIEPDNALFAARIQEIDGGPAAVEDLAAEVVVEDLSFGESDEAVEAEGIEFEPLEEEAPVVEVDESAPGGVDIGAPEPAIAGETRVPRCRRGVSSGAT